MSADHLSGAPARDAIRRAAPRLLLAAVCVYAFLAGCGLLLTRVFPDGPLIRNDRAVSQWFFQHRTAALDQLSHISSTMSDTVAAIAVTVVLVLGLRWWLGRWREPVAVVVSILGELFIFVLVTATVHRQRPTVPHLDPAPPTSSFPSGHTGAALALYVGLGVVLVAVSRQSSAPGSRRRALAWAASAVLALVPIAVALSRLYRGMHFLTDVVAGALAGGLWTAMVMLTLLRARADETDAGLSARPRATAPGRPVGTS
jgi:membrane-associated phospholipid phosphatase